MSNKSNEKENIRIGRLLAYARETHNLLQADMVESTGLTKNHISALERGVSKPSVETLLGYCNRLDITPNEILGFNEDSIMPELKMTLSKMDLKQQEKILAIIKIINE